jgi:membrane fusion protein (multidrug efflux system)
LLTTISSVDPIHVRFSISERDYLAWRRAYSPDRPGHDRAKGIFELILADGTLHPHRGDIAFADRQVDPRTGTLLLEVAFPNPEQIVRPGQFGRVRFAVEVLTNAVLVPQRAVQELQAIYSVFVVTPESTAEFRKVELGPRADMFYVIKDGLKPGEKIVVEGVQKLQNGVPVAATLTNLTAAVRGDGRGK